ncbi:type 1 glutamine amidotransferase [Salidesulfovibrio onnuriiensis]|uniref:type 1 glutamine amidotransferase n=1 Tax=Salidesulfovibrio onnuriiensis TaxID=2583823 RepID=UPI0011C966D8|nr:type 1 glutamine amidotransferase [Salidesulfovibrio onnuriiensis]
MRIHFLQHEDFEHPAYLGEWMGERGHGAATTRADREESFPELVDFDMLVILGGLASVYEVQDRPGVRREMAFIRRAVEAGKYVLGFCFGAQLLSASLGGEVTAMDHPEIGWHEVRLTQGARSSERFKYFPERFIAPVWHGDMFSIPPNALRTISGEYCPNQGYMLGDRVFGFQVLLHMTPANLEEFIGVIGEPVPGPNVQAPEEVRSGLRHVDDVNRLLAAFLDGIASGGQGS